VGDRKELRPFAGRFFKYRAVTLGTKKCHGKPFGKHRATTEKITRPRKNHATVKKITRPRKKSRNCGKHHATAKNHTTIKKITQPSQNIARPRTKLREEARDPQTPVSFFSDSPIKA
jgi:hypothetical protein